MAQELGLPAADRRALQAADHALLHRRNPERGLDPGRAAREYRSSTRPQLDLLRDLAGLAAERLRNGDVDAIGPAMRESWEAKRKLASGVSNDEIDVAVTRALDAGALAPS